jgi:hydroxyethylthiazole kinase-like sugar kinase family protein
MAEIHFAGTSFQGLYERRRGGRPIMATAHDRIARTLNIITAQGMNVGTVRDSRAASQIAEYMNAVAGMSLW